MGNALKKKALSFYVFKELSKRRRILNRALEEPSFWLKVQNEEIKKFVNYIYNIPFYRKRFEQANITPDDIKTRKDFCKLPPLTKEEYRAWILEETKDKSKFKDWMYRQTTGSSGTPLDLYSLPTDRASEIANLFRCALLQDKGYNPYFGRIFSTMVPKPKKKKKFSLGPANVQMSSISQPKDLIEGYNATKPDFYYGNKTAILMIAQYSLEHGIPLHKPKCVGSISEALDTNARMIINKAFGPGLLFDIYGCAEIGNFAVDRADDPGKHYIWNDTHVVNLYHEKPVEGKENAFSGQLMITSLIHRGFPLVNYIVGDNVEITFENEVPYITKILGRTNDVIKNQDGSTFKWMHINRVMFGMTDLAQFRIIQKSYSDLTFVLASPDMPSERKHEIETNIQDRSLEIFGNDMNTTGKNISFEWCDHIPPDPTGKIRILVSEIK